MTAPVPNGRTLATASVLDRLLAGPAEGRRAGTHSGETVRALRASLRRDLEALLNSRKPWRSLPPHLASLRVSTLSYGLPDFAGGIMNEPGERERLRAAIEEAITRFEPRLTNVAVTPLREPSALDAVVTLRISALLLIEPFVEPVTFDTTVDTTTSDVDLQGRDGG